MIDSRTIIYLLVSSHFTPKMIDICKELKDYFMTLPLFEHAPKFCGITTNGPYEGFFLKKIEEEKPEEIFFGWIQNDAKFFVTKKDILDSIVKQGMNAIISIPRTVLKQVWEKFEPTYGVIDMINLEDTNENSNSSVAWYEPPVDKKKNSAKGKPKREEVEPSLFPIEITNYFTANFQNETETMNKLKLILTEPLQQKVTVPSQQSTPRFSLYYHQTDQKEYVVNTIYPKLLPCITELSTKIATYMRVLEEENEEKLFEPEIDQYLRLKPYEVAKLKQIYNNPLLYLSKLLKEK